MGYQTQKGMQSPGEQVGLEPLAEFGEQLCHPAISWELIPPLRCQNKELGVGRAMPVFSEGL